MARLKGQAAIDYIKQNPGAAYKVISGNIPDMPEFQAQTDAQKIAQMFSDQALADQDAASILQKGFFGGLTKPLRAGAQGLFEAFGGQGNKFQTRAERAAYVDDPFLSATKDQAAIASYLVPGAGAMGGGVKGLVASGVIGGAAGGYGASEKGKEIESTVAGGVVGGALGAGLGALGKLGGKAREAGKVATKFNPEAGGDEVVAFAKSIKGKAPLGQNKIQKNAIMNQYKQLGLTTKKGSLDFVGDYETTVNKLEEARDFFGLERTPEALSEIPARIGELRNNTLAKANKAFHILPENVVSNDGVNAIARNAPKNVTKDQIKAAVYDRIRSALPEEKFAQLDPDRAMRLDLDIDALTLQDIKANTADGYVKFIKGKASKVDDLVDAEIHKWADSQLSQVPGYKQINGIFSELYNANDSFRRAYDTGLKGTYIASPSDAKSAIINKVFDIGNKGIEKVGDFVAEGGMGGKIIGGIGDVAQKLGEFAPTGTIAPRMIGTAAGQAMGNLGEIPDASAMEPGMEGETDLGFGGETDWATAFQDPELEEKKALKADLAMKVLSGEMSAADAKAVASLLGADTKPLTDTAIQRQANATQGLTHVDTLDSLLKKNPGTLYSSKLPNLVTGKDAEIFNAAVKELKEIKLKLRTGASSNAQEDALYDSFIPQPFDDAETIQWKLGQFRNYFIDIAQNPGALNNTGDTYTLE